MQDFFSLIILLVIVIDPVGLAPTIQGIIKGYARNRQRRILRRELLWALAILLFFFFAGNFVLDMLGLEPATLNISGGILLFLVALGMVFPTKNMITPAENKGEQMEPFIVPIAMPLMAGPSSLAIIMLHASQSTDSTSMLLYAGAIVIAWAISGGLLLLAHRFLYLLGERGTIALERMMGMVLILLSVQMFMNGISAYSIK